MKIKLPAFYLLILLFGCSADEKRSSPKPVAEKIPVSFSILGFNVEQTNFDKTGIQKFMGIPTPAAQDTLKTKIGRIYYRLWNSTYSKSVNQTSSSPTFGYITDSIPAGDYQYVVIGAKDTIVDTNDRVVMYGRGTDAFYSKGTISVNQKSALNKDLLLSRVVSKIDITLKNPIPADAYRIQVTGKRWANEMLFSTIPSISSNPSTNDPYPYSFYLDASHIGTKNLTIPIYAFPKSIPDNTLQITAYRRDNSIIATQSVPGIFLLQNVRYAISGNFFPGINTDGFSVKVDENYKSTETVSF